MILGEFVRRTAPDRELQQLRYQSNWHVIHEANHNCYLFKIVYDFYILSWEGIGEQVEVDPISVQFLTLQMVMQLNQLVPWNNARRLASWLCVYQTLSTWVRSFPWHPELPLSRLLPVLLSVFAGLSFHGASSSLEKNSSTMFLFGTSWPDLNGSLDHSLLWKSHKYRAAYICIP